MRLLTLLTSLKSRFYKKKKFKDGEGIVKGKSAIIIHAEERGIASYRAAAGGHFHDRLGDHRLDDASSLDSSRAEGESVFIIIQSEEGESTGDQNKQGQRRQISKLRLERMNNQRT